MSLRGWFGEKLTTFNMWLTLDKVIYRRFHDLIIPSRNGTAQIDHLLVSPYGLFIVETKNKKGWIFGAEDQSRWTQVIWRDKYSFQNPLRQTYRQKRVLAEFLQIADLKIHTVVYFVGDCEFRTDMPENVLNRGLARYIKRFRERLVSETEVSLIVAKLERHVARSPLTHRDHLRSLGERHSSTTTCPRCGGKLVERVAKSGRRAGSKFMGCSSFPGCKFIRNL